MQKRVENGWLFHITPHRLPAIVHHRLTVRDVLMQGSIMQYIIKAIHSRVVSNTSKKYLNKNSNTWWKKYYCNTFMQRSIAIVLLLAILDLDWKCACHALNFQV